MAPLLKAAIIQFQPKPIDVEANFAYSAARLREAAVAGALVGILPEYHLTSWVPEHPEFVAASAKSGAYLARYQALAREINISIVPGTIVEAHSTVAAASKDGGSGSPSTLVFSVDGPVELRNMSYFIAAGTGELVGHYQKVNLWHPERPYLTAPTAAAAKAPGSTVAWPPHQVFDTPWTWGTADSGNNPQRRVRAGLLICWDLAFPEAFRALVADGADIIFIPSFWNTTEDVDATALAININCEALFLRSTLVSRAYENTCAVVFCNTGGVSQLAQPLVGASGEILPGEERVSLVDIDLDYLRIADKNYRIRADMHRPGWTYEYTLPKSETAAPPEGKP